MRGMGDFNTPWGRVTTAQAALGGGALLLVGCSLGRSGIGKLLLLGVGLYVFSRVAGQVKQPPLKLKQPLPPGAQPTGNVQQTTSGGKPGEEVVGFVKRVYAEVMLPNGQRDWVEAQISGPYSVSA